MLTTSSRGGGRRGKRGNGSCRSIRSAKIAPRWHSVTRSDRFRSLTLGSRQALPSSRSLGLRSQPGPTIDNDHFRSIFFRTCLFPQHLSCFALTTDIHPCFVLRHLPLPSKMPRTKNTARKSTGGDAKRKLLLPSTRTLRPRTSQSKSAQHSPQPASDVEMAVESTTSKFILH